ncbi:CLUMA_CG013131, isoform A [Clunio marinus]|uniref:CLUMA_CG013131, isoform A n=1 Tax=Clunio marinus TaxID=568069 RepID=A0A1J1IHT6_9DIPT|nr:CLUMA_CG013131, isoform A [Clunio marinus]
MDSTVVTATATDTDEANEIHQQLPSTATNDDDQHEGHEDELNLQIKINNIGNKEYKESQEKNSNKQQQETPINQQTTTNSSYNDYVNHLYNDGVNGKIETTINDDEEEIKPLLKSIVKSPSGNLRPSLPLNGTRSKNKRLSWQAASTVDSSRQHVQFNNNHNQQDGNDVNTQSTSLASSDEPVTQNEECPSSPITSSSSSSSDDDDEFSEIQAPDGGWGWVVVFASFLVNMIADGITFSFGIYNVEFLKYFGDSKGKTAWIGSIFMASPLLSGPIASYLTDRYGCRKVTIVGSITAAIGFLLSAMADSMEMLFVTFGVISGVGLSLCYVAAVVIVAYYFDKRRSFATGISVCGSGIGTFIFPPIIQYLISEYGWRGCTVILAGIFLNMCVCGALMRDLEWTTHRAKQKRKNRLKTKNGTSYESFSITNSTNNGTTAVANDYAGKENCATGFDPCIVEAMAEDDPHLFSSLINLPTFTKDGEKIPIGVLEQLAKNRNFHDVILHNYPHLLATRSLSNCDQLIPIGSSAILSPTTVENSISQKNRKHRHTIQIGESETNVSDKWLRQHHHHHHDSHVMDILKDLRIHRHSLTYRGAMLNINRYRLRASSCPDIYRNSMTTIASEGASTTQMVSEFMKLFKDILDFSYFLDIRFLLFAISNFILYTWYDVVYVYLPDWAIEHQVTETDASMLISLIGIINMFGEIALGWAGDRDELNPNIIYAISMGFCGVSVLAIPFFVTYQWMCVLSSAFGLFIAANYSLTSIILVNLVDLDRFTNAYGLLLLVQGVANLVGPPIAGWGYDLTGTYDLSFYLAGGFIVVSGALLMILPILGRFRKYQRRKESQNSESEEVRSEVKNTRTENGTANGICV